MQCYCYLNESTVSGGGGLDPGGGIVPGGNGRCRERNDREGEGSAQGSPPRELFFYAPHSRATRRARSSPPKAG